jgi:hypothetical protein
VIGLLVTLVVVGLILYLVENYIPMSPPFKIVIRVIVVLFLILWLVRLFGLDVPLTRFR